MEGQAGRAEQISMEEFVEGTTRAVLRALQAVALNPQPLPPREAQGQEEVAPLNPQPLPPFEITVGIVVTGGDEVAVAPSTAKR